MSSKQIDVDLVLSQMAGAGPVTARKMFGEYTISCGTKVVALICDDELFLKPTIAGRTFIQERSAVVEKPPYPTAEPYLMVGANMCGDRKWLSELVRLTAAELPEPVRKQPKPAVMKKSPAAKRAS
ncbi:MAG TPA: TfoX/Sxy family protein [Kofleriaceae bacterium]